MSSLRPQRIQLRRTKGWRMPDDAVNVARPGKWGNPFRVDVHGRADAVELYRRWLSGSRWDASYFTDQRRRILDGLTAGELTRRDLACWCPLDVPCHADVLLDIANPTNPSTAKKGDS